MGLRGHVDKRIVLSSGYVLSGELDRTVVMQYCVLGVSVLTL
jgi:hypothetical protein